MLLGYGEGNRPTFDSVPEVTTVWPGLTTSWLESDFRTSWVGCPSSTARSPLTPVSETVAPTCMSWLVMSVTVAPELHTNDTLPTRPCPVTTAWSVRTPAELPLSIVIWSNQRLGSSPITRAATGALSARPAVWLSLSCERSCRSSRSCACIVTFCWRRTSFSLRRSLSWPFASSVSPVQPKRSRTGLSARLAPSWIGEMTSRTPRCTECSPPPADSPKYAVSSIRELATSSPRTTRLRRTVLSYTRRDSPKLVGGYAPRLSSERCGGGSSNSCSCGG